jgi:hypothetical protein|tara:strand:- start:372 stop:710 length:339 start_codon:yes stop_codon:yes gene_type:complete
MTDDKVMIDFEEEDFIITVSPTLDEELRWTGEVKVGITMGDQDFLHADDYYNLLQFCNLICTTIPMMEKDVEFREKINNYYLKDLKELNNRVLTKEGNVIKLNFSSKIDGSA